MIIICSSIGQFQSITINFASNLIDRLTRISALAIFIQREGLQEVLLKGALIYFKGTIKGYFLGLIHSNNGYIY